MAVVRLCGPTLPPIAATIVGQIAAAASPSNARRASSAQSLLTTVTPKAVHAEMSAPPTISGRLPSRSPSDPIGDLKPVSTRRNAAKMIPMWAVKPNSCT